MHEAEGLAQIVAERQPHASVIGIVAQPFRPDQLVEMLSLNLSVLVHSWAP